MRKTPIFLIVEAEGHIVGNAGVDAGCRIGGRGAGEHPLDQHPAGVIDAVRGRIQLRIGAEERGRVGDGSGRVPRKNSRVEDDGIKMERVDGIHNKARNL